MNGVLLAVAAASSACLPVTSDRITVGDLARAVPELTAAPSEVVLSYAPLPGRTRIFAPGEIVQIGARHGLDVPASSACFEWTMTDLSPDLLRDAMIQALDQPGAEVVVEEAGRGRVPQGRLVFPISGLRRPVALSEPAVWNGYLEYAPGRKLPVRARVRVLVPYSRVILTRPLRTGEVIEPDAVRREFGTGFPPDRDVVAAVENAAGRIVRRALPAGAVLTHSALANAPVIRKGDAVRVEVFTGAARIAFDGTAEASGAIGQSIPIRNPQTGKPVRARIAAPGQAVLAMIAN